jgi:hypothetical protein
MAFHSAALGAEVCFGSDSGCLTGESAGTKRKICTTGVFVGVAVRQSFNNGDTSLPADFADEGIAGAVGDPGLNLTDVGNANRSRPLELRTVGDKDGLTRIL